MIDKIYKAIENGEYKENYKVGYEEAYGIVTLPDGRKGYIAIGDTEAVRVNGEVEVCGQVLRYSYPVGDCCDEDMTWEGEIFDSLDPEERDEFEVNLGAEFLKDLVSPTGYDENAVEFCQEMDGSYLVADEDSLSADAGKLGRKVELDGMTFYIIGEFDDPDEPDVRKAAAILEDDNLLDNGEYDTLHLLALDEEGNPESVDTYFE